MSELPKQPKFIVLKCAKCQGVGKDLKALHDELFIVPDCDECHGGEIRLEVLRFEY